VLQIVGVFRDPLVAYTRHVGNQFMDHGQLITGQTIKAQQQPAAKPLAHRVVAIAYCGLRHQKSYGCRSFATR